MKPITDACTSHTTTLGFPLVILSCLVIIFSSLQTIYSEEQVTHQPNIILCMADDQGWGDVGYNGHPVLQTPHLDQMARDGMRFDRFYAAAPVCSPTRASVVTGRHPMRMGIPWANTGKLPDQEHTIAEILQQQGYRTGHFGKWHLGTLSLTVKDGNRGGTGEQYYAPPWLHGFDTCFSTESKVPTYWAAPGYTKKSGPNIG